MNAVADSLDGVASFAPIDDAGAPAEVEALFTGIRTFYDRADVPIVFRLLARDPGYLGDFFQAVCRAFGDQRLTRRVKEALAFAVSVTSRSRFGTGFHVGEMRRLGV